MEDNPKLHQVEIFGQSYNLRGEGDPKYITQIAAYVDKVMHDVSDNTGVADTLKVAILASLNIADDYLSMKKKHPTEKGEDLKNKISLLIQKIDRCLGEE
jgi:cell division protein ZapA